MDTKTALLDSAERTAREKGYDGFSYADLAKDVGIRKASIHHHFPTKTDLALALVKRYQDRFAEKLETVAQAPSTGAAKLSAFLEANRAALDGGSKLCLCVAFSAGCENLAEDVRRQLNKFHGDALSWLSDVFALGKEDKSIARVGDPAKEAAACLALVDGAQLMARAARDPARFDSAVEQLRERLK